MSEYKYMNTYDHGDKNAFIKQKHLGIPLATSILKKKYEEQHVFLKCEIL